MSIHAKTRRQHQADEKQGVDAQGEAHLFALGPPAEIEGGEFGSDRLDHALAEVIGQADAEHHHGDTDGHEVDARQIADDGVHDAQQRADQPGRDHAQPGSDGDEQGLVDAERASQVPEPLGADFAADGVGGHRPHHERSFQAEIDTSRPLGDAFAQTDEEERRADADRAAEQGQSQGREVNALPDRTVRKERIHAGATSFASRG